MRLGTLMLTLMLSGLLLVACSNPAADKTKAVTSEASSASPQSPASGEKYAVNPQNSKIEFVASKVTGSHHGEFQEFSGGIYSHPRVRIAVETKTRSKSIPLSFM